MGRYVLSRLIRWFPSVFIVLLLVYALVFFGAGDPIKLIFLQAPGDVAYNPERVEAMRVAAGLDRPFFVQFFEYLWNVMHGDFGNSLVSGRSVNSMIQAALPVTLQIGLSAIVIVSLVGILLGVIAGLNQNKFLDNLIVSFALIIWGIPVFVTGPMIIVFMVLVLNMDVPYGWAGLFDPKVIVPLLVLGLNPMALIIRQSARRRSGGAERGLCPHRARQGHSAISGGAAPHPAACADAGCQPDRPSRHRDAEQFNSDRKGLRAARSRSVDRNLDQVLGLSGHSRHRADLLDRGHDVQPSGGHFLPNSRSARRCEKNGG